MTQWLTMLAALRGPWLGPHHPCDTIIHNFSPKGLNTLFWPL